MALSETSLLTIKIAAEDLTGPAFTQAETKMGKLKSAIGGLTGALTGAGAATLVGALSDAARAGAEEQASLSVLQTAIENSGQGWDKNRDSVMAAIDAGKKLGFNNEDLAESLGLLVAQTGDVDESMTRQTAAMNLARGAHIDLYTASKLLGKVTDDNVNVLARYGIVVQKGATETELFALIQQKFGGQAEAYGNTTAGAIDKTKVAIQDWQQAIGNSLGPAQAYIALLPGISSGMLLIGSLAGGAGSALTALTGVTLAAAAPFIAVGAAIALVGVALWQVGETIVLVKDNWDKFVFALTTGQLNDIPIFGFFFGQAQRILAGIQVIINAWNSMVALISQPVAPAAETSGGGGGGGGSYASGTSYVPQTGLAMLHEGEAVIPRDMNRGGTWGSPTIIVNVAGSVLSENELVDVISDRLVGQLFSQRNLSF